MPRGPDQSGGATGPLVALALALAFALLCGTSLVRKSSTWDETKYLARVGAPDVRPASILHPPLSAWIHGLPFLGWDVPDEVWNEPDPNRRGQRIVALRGDDWMLDASRVALLPVGIALAALVYVWAGRLYGTGGGLLAMAFFAFDPNVIAHARLITPDTTLAGAAAFALYRLWRLAEAPGRGARLWAGVAVGLMLLSKYTALLLLPIFLAADAAFRVASGRASLRAPHTWKPVAVDWLCVLGLGAIALWLGYGLDVGRVAAWPELPLPAPRYVEGALYQWQQSRLPHSFFLGGELSTAGWWYFFPLVLGIKVPVATLLLLAGAALAGRRLGLGARPEEIYCWLPFVLLLVYLSFFNTIHNGFRYLLPVWVPLLVWAGRVAVPAARSKGLRAAVFAGVAWVAGASLWIWPHYLAYCNELIGGPRHGYHWLSDSNLDWGQDLKALRAWMDERGIDRVQLAYFGTADPRHYGIDYTYLPSANSRLEPTPPLAEGEAPPRIVALSAYQYQGVGFGDPDAYAFFRRHEPNDLVGYSILVYDLDRLRTREN